VRAARLSHSLLNPVHRNPKHVRRVNARGGARILLEIPMHDPNQPRIPEGHHGGGRWTRGGYGYLSDVGKLRIPPQPDDEVPQAPDDWEQQPDDLYLLSDLDRLRPESGAQYARAGGFRPPSPPAPVPDLLGRIGAALASAVAAFEAWSRRDNGDRQTFATFRAREFVADERGLIVLPEQVRTLDRETVIAKHCRRLKVIEELLDETLKDHPQDTGETNSNYGIRIHKLLEWKIENDPKKKYEGLKAEVSITDNKDEIKYGTKGSVVSTFSKTSATGPPASMITKSGILLCSIREGCSTSQTKSLRLRTSR
jgi:hypothetical protein